MNPVREKAPSPIRVRLDGKVISVNEVQFIKVFAAIWVKLGGKIIFVNEWQPEKACSPMLVKVSGSEIVLNPHPLKAEYPIVSKTSLRIISDNALHPLKAASLIRVTPWGILTDFSCLQTLNIDVGISVIFSGKTAVCKEVQP